ncbi:rho guanine nucleotide exchange factor 12 isoform X1 [Calypte anna]|uniref:rho guanine nucleotide exchange factor 12 isoform X1 n=2 Tax=Calypte anna TaxID=9244 RepID=UPI0011C38C49|nr:rho guanine nucleotide exchange factor 12 isoform X1 [Calypte anna]XP_030320588.1 rho guanine nucleotide exchange factor 12 isoform X1 [Calypte anna]
MSGTQSTITDRFPLKKPTRHGSILSRESPADKKQKVERCSSTHDFDPTDSSSKKTKSSSEESRSETYGLVQRCVVIQRDENGFGLTVSGDNPVFVQSVKEDGAAMRAGVQTGDRIIKVNGTLVTHSNHLEVVKLIKSGSYVALTVQGRPPGSPQIPLADSEVDLAAFGHMSPIMTSPHSPGTSGNAERITSPVLMGEENNIVHNQKVEILRKMLQKEQERLQALQEEYSRSPTPRLLKEIQETKKHIPQLQEQLSKATGSAQDGVLSSRSATESLQISEVEAESGDCVSKLDYSGDSPSRPNSDIADSPRSGLKDRIYPDDSPEKTEVQDTDSQSSIGSPLSRVGPQIIGAEDDDFDTEQEQINGQCSCFQNIELLKSRPAHLAVLLHHVVSQFDPAALLCYLYTDLYKQTNSKETRRVFLEFYQFFLDRAANLKVPVPDEISLELDRRRPELLPEELHRQFIQTMQDKVCPEVQKNLEDFRQKRSMGLTLAEGELTKLDAERVRDRNAVEKERACAEQIIAKIEEVLMTSQPLEEDKSSTMQYVILTYMKHLGVKVKEPRNLEQKRGRIGFLPKIKQSIKKEKEGEEKGKRRGFPNILGPPRRPSRHDSSAIGRAMEMQKPRHPKHLPTASSVSPEPPDSSKSRQSGSSSEGTDAPYPAANPMSPLAVGPFSSPEGSKDSETGLKQTGEAPPANECIDGTPRTPNNTFEFPSPLENLQEEDGESERMVDMGTPKPFRKMDSVGFADVQSEDELYDFDMDMDPPNWQQLVSREVLMGLKPYEIKRQEVINELFYTERAHVRTLKVLHNVFYQRVTREGILNSSDKRKIFSNLEDILGLHVALNDQMKAVRKRNETSVIGEIGEDLLSWFSGPAEEKLKHATATFCSNQPFALEVIKSRQKKDSRFQTFVQDAESNPLCRRLQLKDIIPKEMQRLTKYPLLLDNIAKYTELPEEKEKVKQAADHCRQILNHVNQAVKESENKQHLEDYQRRLDLSYLKQSEDPMMDEFRNLDLTKRKMLHEGPLIWKVNRDKTIDLYTLLLEDILVLLQKQDDKLVLKCHSKILASTADSKHTFSPIIKLNTVLVRQVATDNKAFFVISMSENGAHIYELVAQTVSEKNVWQDLIAQMAGTVKMGSTRRVIPLPPQSGPGEEEREEEEQQKLKEQHEIPASSLQSPDKDLGLESPLILNAQSSSPIMSEKSKVESLLGSERQFDKVQQADLTLKGSSACYEHTTTSLPSEGQWALDALRNLGLLKQLLVQQLGFSEKGTLGDRQRFPRFRTLSQEAQTEREGEPGLQHSDNNKFHQPGADGMLPRTGTTESPAGYGLRTSAESPASGDAMQLGGRDPRSNSGLAIDHMSMNLEISAPELEGGGADESGEHFFDAREAHSDENPSEGELMERKEEEDVQIRISGNYLILDGYGTVQESSTDEEVSALVLQCTAGGHTSLDSAQQQPLSPRDTQSDGGSSPFPEEMMASRWGGVEESCPFVASPHFSLESRLQMMRYIQKIEDDLEKLKEVEEDYSILRRQGLAGSASPGEHSEKS